MSNRLLVPVLFFDIMTSWMPSRPDMGFLVMQVLFYNHAQALAIFSVLRFFNWKCAIFLIHITHNLPSNPSTHTFWHLRILHGLCILFIQYLHSNNICCLWPFALYLPPPVTISISPDAVCCIMELYVHDIELISLLLRSDSGPISVRSTLKVSCNLIIWIKGK